MHSQAKTCSAWSRRAALALGGACVARQRVSKSPEDQDAIAEAVVSPLWRQDMMKTEAAAFLWLDEPLLQNTETAADLSFWGADRWRGRTVLEQAAKGKEPDEVLVLLGAIGRGGAASIGVKRSTQKRRKGHGARSRRTLSVGFRPGHTQPLLLGRFFGGSIIKDASAARRYRWVHGRGQDVRRLSARRSWWSAAVRSGHRSPARWPKRVSKPPRRLDPERLTWPNVGRHPLGATAVRAQQGRSLAERLQADFPHLNVPNIALVACIS